MPTEDYKLLEVGLDFLFLPLFIFLLFFFDVFFLTILDLAPMLGKY